MAPKKIAQTVLTEGKFYTISAANGKVIEVADYNIDNGAKIQLMGGVSDGTRVHQWEGAQASSQLWVVEPTNDGRVKIKSNLAGKLLDPGMATENGTVLQIWADVNGDNQFWTINEVTRKPKTSVKATTVKAKAAAEKAADLKDAAAEKAGDLKDAAADAAEKAKDAADTAKEKAADAADAAKDKADDAKKAAEDK